MTNTSEKKITASWDKVRVRFLHDYSDNNRFFMKDGYYLLYNGYAHQLHDKGRCLIRHEWIDEEGFTCKQYS